MERWGVAVNNVYKTGHIYREVGPWYVFFIEWVADFICNLFYKLPSIPLPKWHTCKHCFLGPKYLETNEVSTLYEEYGDLAGLVCSRFHDSILQWCHKRFTETRMEADIDDLGKFYSWVAELTFQDDEDGARDSWRQSPEFKELEEARQQIFDLWERRAELTEILIHKVRDSHAR